MGTWNENDEAWLDKLLNLVKSFWKAIVILVIVCIAAKMDLTDQARAEAMVSLFYPTEPTCHMSKDKWSGEPVKICRAGE